MTSSHPPESRADDQGASSACRAPAGPRRRAYAVRSAAPGSVDLSAALLERSAELASRWREALADRLDLEPERVLPSGDRNRVARLVAAVIDAPAHGADSPIERLDAPGPESVPEDVLDTLRELSIMRREQLYPLGQVLLELGLLQRILFEAMEEEAERLARAADVIRAGSRIAAGVQLLGAVLAHLYVEGLEEERAFDGPHLFGRMLGHEIREPLNAALLASEALHDGSARMSAENREALLAAVPRNLRRTADLIHSVTLLTQPDSGAPTGCVRRLDAVVEQVLSDLRGKASQNGVRMAAEHPLPDVRVDASRLQLIVYNLVSNALKYCDTDKDERWVRVRAVVCDEVGCRIEISDNGLGIAEEEQARVFDRFYRVDGGSAQGIGLGLAIAREAARQLGASIDLESRRGVGSTFAVSVPLR